MEDLTDQVEIIFHPGPVTIDPQDSAVIQLEAVDIEPPTTSTDSPASGHPFKIPQLPTKIPKESRRLLEGGFIEVDDGEADDGDDEWEETLIYVDLDDIPSVQELFAVQPDDFLLSQGKRDREEEPKFAKPMQPKLTLKFYNLDDKNPILQIGDRFYMGKYEEPFGTDLFFREKGVDLNDADSGTDEDPLGIERNDPTRTVLRSLVSDPDPPSHPVFGMQKNCTTEYELVAKVHKILKMTRRNVLRCDEPLNEAAQISNDDHQLPPSVSLDGTSNSEEPPVSDQIPVQPMVELPQGIVAQQIREGFVPKKTVDLNVTSLSSSSMSSRLKRRNKAYLKGLDADEELRDADNNSDGD